MPNSEKSKEKGFFCILRIGVEVEREENLVRAVTEIVLINIVGNVVDVECFHNFRIHTSPL